MNLVQKPSTVLLSILLVLFVLSACTGKSSIQTDLPNSFAMVAANPTAPLQAEIIWQSAKGATSYNISYGTSSGVYSKTITASADSSALVVTGLSDGVTYYFKVSASNLAGTQPAANEISITVYDSLAISSISPSQGFFAGGQIVTLTGVGFKPGSTVQIDGSPCTSVNVVSSTTITCKTPRKIIPATTNVSVIESPEKIVTLMNSYSYKSDAFQKLEFFKNSSSRAGHKNAIGTSAKFFRPTKPLVYNGYVYISDTNNHMIRRMNLTTKQVEDVAGEAYAKGTTDGIGNAARFFYPMGMVRVGSDIFIADSGNCTIRKLDTTTNTVTTIVGQGNQCYPADNANGALAGLGSTHALTTDGTNLYVGDDSGLISRVSLTPPYATFAIQTSVASVIDLIYLNNALYFAEHNGLYSKVFKMDLTTEAVSLLAGGNTSVDADGVGSAATFNYMGGLDTDGTDLYISSTKANKLKRIVIATKTVTTLAGNGSPGQADGLGTGATLFQPAGLFYTGGEIYISSLGGSTLRKYNVSTTSVTTLSGGGQ